MSHKKVMGPSGLGKVISAGPQAGPPALPPMRGLEVLSRIPREYIVEVGSALVLYQVPDGRFGVVFT